MDIEEMKGLINEVHGVDAFHVANIQVVRRAEGRTVWEVDVAIFELISHPSATRVYVWQRDPKDDPTNPDRVISVLHDGRAIWCADAAVRSVTCPGIKPEIDP
jgi:hypothetical protein